jgi:hypothetical protein
MHENFRFNFNTSTINRHAQEGGGYGCCAGCGAFVLAVKQRFQFALQLRSLAVLFCCLKSIHGGAIVILEGLKEFGRWARSKVQVP